MKNTVTALIEFYFKGEKFSPSIIINLDEYIKSNNPFPNLCSLIAIENKIDHYSYEYEMMQAETIQYTDAKGLVESFIIDGVLNIDGFMEAWLDEKIHTQLSSIAKTHMSITDLKKHPDLKYALLEAYRLGNQDD